MNQNDKQQMNVKKYAELINKLIPASSKKLVLSGNHRNINIKKSMNYLNTLKQLVPNITLSVDESPDLDLCKMVNANYFIAGRGGFSSLAVQLRNLTGKKTYVSKETSGWIKKGEWIQVQVP